MVSRELTRLSSTCCRTGLGLRGRGTRGGLLRTALAEAFAFVLAGGSLEATALGLGAAHNWAKELRDMEVEEDSEVRGQITWREPEVCVVELVASMLVDSPRGQAANSGSVNTSATVETALMLKSTLCRTMSKKTIQEGCGSNTFLGDFVDMD